MKTIVILFLFIGLFFITHAIYEKKLEQIEKNKKVEYKFIPRSLYEEQLADPDVFKKFGGLFNTENVDIRS